MVPPAAQPGMRFAEIDTPALIVDLDAFERNLKRMADAAARAGVRLRPHAKTHKCSIIAQKQIALGAVGVCCQKVSEAEILVRDGIGDVLISNEVVGARKIERLVALAKQARIAVCVDDAGVARDLAAAAERADVTLSVLVEIDVGGNRCGVAPGAPALRLAQEIARSNALRFGGLQAYNGSAQHKRTLAERQAAIAQVAAQTRETVALLAKNGLRCETIGGAGTGTFELEAAGGVIDELQAGSYVFMDVDYGRNKKADGGPFDTFENALFVLATVMSRPDGTRAVVDAGHKTLPIDSGMPEPYRRPGIHYGRPSDEHGVLTTDGPPLPHLGERILLVPAHCDPTVNLHDWLIGVRGLHGTSPVVETVWPVSARGAVF